MTPVGWGPDQFRVGPWTADSAIAHLALGPNVLKPTVDGLRRVLDLLAADGYRGVTTTALRPPELPPFLQAGFTERERLTILHHDLDAIPPLPANAPKLRRATRFDRDRVLEIDHAAFSPGWRLDPPALSDALSATPRARYRVALSPELCGYAICGRSTDCGYLQRLAVEPSRQGAGIGATLVVDALEWLRRRGARSALVNTQDGNQRALDLYHRLGFRDESYDLIVLERSIP